MTNLLKPKWALIIVFVASQLGTDVFAQPPGYGGGGGGGGPLPLPAALFGTSTGTVNPVLTNTTLAFDQASANPFQTCANMVSYGDSCEINALYGSSGPAGGCGTCSPTKFAPFRSAMPRFPALHSKLAVPYSMYFTRGNSLVENQRFNYLHWAQDFPKPEGNSVGLARIHRTRDWSVPGSYGPGVFSNLDLRLSIEVNASGDNGYVHYVTIFDPLSESPIYVSPVPPVSYGYQVRARSVEYFNAQMQPISGEASSPSDPALPIPAFCRVNLWEGGFFKFQLVNVELPPSDPDSGIPTHGRLIEAKTVDGFGYTINYKSWIPAQLEVSPNRQWQFDTVVDFSGASFGFTYDAAQSAPCGLRG